MIKINESFICISCKSKVSKANKTCRNHCPFCFTSLHIDWDIPWDRNTNCMWIMLPIDYDYKSDWTKILFCCKKCGKKHRNKQSDDDCLENLISIIQNTKHFF